MTYRILALSSAILFSCNNLIAQKTDVDVARQTDRAMDELREENREFANEKRDADEDLVKDLKRFVERADDADAELQKRNAAIEAELADEGGEVLKALDKRNKELIVINAELRLELAQLYDRYAKKVERVEEDYQDEASEFDREYETLTAKRIEAEGIYYRSLRKAEQKMLGEVEEYDAEIEEAQQERTSEQVEALEELGEKLEEIPD